MKPQLFLVYLQFRIKQFFIAYSKCFLLKIVWLMYFVKVYFPLSSWHQCRHQEMTLTKSVKTFAKPNSVDLR